MSAEDFQDDLAFEAADNAADDGLGLILDIDGYEGPLHLLLELARGQKVDLTRISILELAEQYLNFIKNAQNLRIELAADYLVMASWLAYLKSRMILPREDGEAPEIEPAELAAHLAFRLQRLEAMRRAAQALFRLPMTGETIFPRGNPEGLRSKSSPLYEAEMFDLLKAYGESRSKAVFRNHKVPKPRILSLSDARTRLRRAMSLSGLSAEHWLTLSGLLPEPKSGQNDVPHESVKASSLLAGLEMAKDGEIFLRQDGVFSEIYIRASGQDSRRKDIDNQD